MMKRILMAAGVAAALTTPAMAADDAAQAAAKENKTTCESMIKQLDEVLASGKLADAAKEAVEKARAAAAEQMKAGDEEGCKASLGKAMEALKG